MRLQTLGGIVAGLLLAASPVNADVRITIDHGHVTLSAHDATLRQILTEWARVGQTRIVNVEQLSGSPVTLELIDVPEGDALDTLLRSVTGYLAAPRASERPDASLYDRIFLLPTSAGTPVRAAASRPSRPSAPAPRSAPPVFAQPDDRADASNVGPGRRVVPPAFTRFPQPPVQGQPANAAAPAAPQSYAAPTAPIGVARPGMPVPVPQPPGQQPAPNDQPQ